MASTDGVVEVCGACGRSNRVAFARLTSNARCGQCGAPVRSAGAPVEVDSESLPVLLGAANVPVVVDFWAPWCGPCKALAPELDRVARAMAHEIVVAKLNVDDSAEAARLYGARAIPLVVMFVNGKPAWRQTGLRSAAELEAALRAALDAGSRSESAAR